MPDHRALAARLRSNLTLVRAHGGGPPFTLTVAEADAETIIAHLEDGAAAIEAVEVAKLMVCAAHAGGYIADKEKCGDERACRTARIVVAAASAVEGSNQ